MPSSAWEVASATAEADDAAKGTPRGKGKAGHHETREVRKDMVGRKKRTTAWLRSFVPSKIRGIRSGHDFDRIHDQGSNYCLNLKGNKIAGFLGPWGNLN